MSDTRYKNANWNVGERPSLEGAQLTVLMDIRDELQAIRRLIECPNVAAGFRAMKNLDRKTPDKRKKVKR